MKYAVQHAVQLTTAATETNIFPVELAGYASEQYE